MNKISVFWDHIREAAEQQHDTLEAILEQIKGSGISGIEIEFDYFRENYSSVSTLLEAFSLEVSCIYQFYDWGNHSDTEKGKQQVEMAKKVGAKRILVVPGFLSEEDTKAIAQAAEVNDEAVWAFMDGNTAVRRMRDALKVITAYGEEKEVMVTLEDFDAENAPFARTAQLLWFMRQVPGLCYTLDMGNFVYSDEDVLSAYERLKDDIVHVHCKDRSMECEKKHGKVFRGLGACAVGSGYMPIEMLLGKLKGQGYRGYLAIEHFGSRQQLNDIRQSALWLKSVL